MERKIRKAIIPAAGLGTRFLPQSKAIPKEMLPVVDKPVIQYVVEEVVASGIKDIMIVTGRQKRAIEDHFSDFQELEEFLARKGKEKELSLVREISQLANFIYIRQKGNQYGNAIPILSAKPALDNEFFAVLWGDEFILAQPPRLLQMIKVFEKYGGAVLSGYRIRSKQELSRYGIGDVKHLEGNVYRMRRMVEKPAPGEAPSDLGIIGAYILPSDIFEIIENLEPGKGGEIWLGDAINILIEQGFPVYVCEIQNAKYYDTGNKLEYLKTIVDFALKHPELGKDFREYLKNLGLQNDV